MKRNSDANYRRIINSKRWQRVRAAKLRRQPLCEDCLSAGRAVSASEVHHVVPLSRGRSYGEMERLAFDPANLRSLCRDCHAAAHRRLASASVGSCSDARAASADRFVEKYLDS